MNKFRWTVSLLGQFNVRAISITLGYLSSEIVDIRLETANKNSTSCAKYIGDLKNSTTVFCSADSVSHVVVHATSRLHLCSFKVYAINARMCVLYLKGVQIRALSSKNFV